MIYSTVYIVLSGVVRVGRREPRVGREPPVRRHAQQAAARLQSAPREGASAEDGPPAAAAHLPEAGDRPHAEGHRHGAQHAGRPEAGHRGHHHHERGAEGRARQHVRRAHPERVEAHQLGERDARLLVHRPARAQRAVLALAERGPAVELLAHRLLQPERLPHRHAAGDHSRAQRLGARRRRCALLRSTPPLRAFLFLFGLYREVFVLVQFTNVLVQYMNTNEPVYSYNN